MNTNPYFVRAVRGPILLITIGVLFAIDHAGGLPFERTWPAIIIVIGVLKLLERAVAPQYNPAYPSGPAWTPPANAGAPGPTWTPNYPGGYQPQPPQQPPAGSADPTPGERP